MSMPYDVMCKNNDQDRIPFNAIDNEAEVQQHQFLTQWIASQQDEAIAIALGGNALATQAMRQDEMRHIGKKKANKK